MNTKVDEPFTLTYPAKTFLIGEYAVLKQASCILVNTRPEFKFNVSPNSSLNYPFHKESPAGRFIEKHKEVFLNVSIKVQNPYSQRSGLGLSSAEFNCVYDIYLKKKNLKKNLLKLHQEYCSLNSGSGVDILSQQVKGVCLIRQNPLEVLSIKWPFKDLHFFLVRLQESLSTHDHLKNLKEQNFLKLIQISNQAFNSFKILNEEKFIQCIRDYEDELLKLNLVHKRTQKTIQSLKKYSFCLATKGCGALGAEVFVVFFKKENRENVLKILQPFQIEAETHSIEESIELRV